MPRQATPVPRHRAEPARRTPTRLPALAPAARRTLLPLRPLSARLLSRPAAIAVAPLAALALGAATAAPHLTTAAGDSPADQVPSQTALASSLGSAVDLPVEDRGLRVSRGAERDDLTFAAPQAAPLKVRDTKWVDEDVSVRTGPGTEHKRVGTLEMGDRVRLTGLRVGPWVQIDLDGRSRWVSRLFLSEEKPDPTELVAEDPTAVDPSGLQCSNGTSVSGSAYVVKVHQAVCALWPQITTYGTLRAGSTNHAGGRAVDIMISGSTAWDVAYWLQANAAELGVSEVIHAQRIWTRQRASEGWRYMEDRGSVTANHYDHVHVSTY